MDISVIDFCYYYLLFSFTNTVTVDKSNTASAKQCGCMTSYRPMQRHLKVIGDARTPYSGISAQFSRPNCDVIMSLHAEIELTNLKNSTHTSTQDIYISLDDKEMVS